MGEKEEGKRIMAEENSLVINHLNKKFDVDKKQVEILKDINLTIKKVNLLLLWDTVAVENPRY